MGSSQDLLIRLGAAAALALAAGAAVASVEVPSPLVSGSTAGAPGAAFDPLFAPAPGVRPAPPTLGLASTSLPDYLAQRVLDEDEDEEKPPEEPKPKQRKNPWLALGLSAALPGAGQFYLNPRSAVPFVYAGIEAVSWVLRVSWDHDGDEKTREFEEYAWQGAVDPVAGAPLNEILNEEGNWSWERWREGYRAGECEDAGRDFAEFVATDSTLVTFWFTNRREFYEDIGKYDKYDCGWLSADRRETYRSMRNEANDLLERSRQMGQVILLNHLASSLHAYFQAKGHNSGLEKDTGGVLPDVRMRFAPDAGGGLRAQLVLRRDF